MKVSLDDWELVARSKQGDRSAFEEIVRRYQDRTYNVCRYMLQDSNDAEDAAQHVFLKAFTGLKEFKGGSSFYTWLYRITIATCIDEQRKLKTIHDSVEGVISVEDFPSHEPSPDRLYESKEAGRAVRRALQRLPEILRTAIVLKEIEGLSYEQIAEVCGISVGTVKSRLSRARDELRRILLKKR